MTRHDANLLLDETLGGEDGTSPIRFGRHPSESTLLYRNGRRARCKSCGMPPHGGHVRRYTEPDEPAASIGEIIAGVLVLLTWFLALFYALPILAEAVMR